MTSHPVPLPLANRRRFLRHAGAVLLGLGAARAWAKKPDGDRLPITGVADARLSSFDDLMTSFVKERMVPGAALAVTRRGKLVYSRGFGCADVETKEAVAPAALFRIASVSKPITAATVLRLVEKGRLSLDDKALDHLKYRPHLEKGASADPRWKQVTILQLLRHTGGWDRDRTFDPIGIPMEIAKSLGIKPPVRPEHVVRYMMGKPLDFDPGKRYAYSNLGYLLLGRVIEAVSGKPYETCVRDEVLAPLGIKEARLGKALLEDRAKGEVRYYDPKKRTGPAVTGPRVGETVPLQYGAENFEAFEAHGGWTASAVDLVRFAAAFDDPTCCPILKEKSLETMWSRPEGLAGHTRKGKPRDAYYGCGWEVRPADTRGKVSTWHGGYIAGSEALLVRRWDGLDWAVLFNTDGGSKSLVDGIDPLVHEAANKVKEWPDKDLFEK
jgi:CubicO group peptidase (beta-lactamase class C family)